MGITPQDIGSPTNANFGGILAQGICLLFTQNGVSSNPLYRNALLMRDVKEECPGFKLTGELTG